MGNRRLGNALVALVFGTVCALLMWHVTIWNNNGAYARMYNDIVGTGALLPVFYNLGVIVMLSLCLGVAVQSVTRALGIRVRKIKHYDDKKR
jgi:hypothetical protein